MSLIISDSRGGTGGGVSSIPSDLRFSGATLSACQTARDSFFTANPSRLVNGVQILLQPTGASIVMQLRDGATWRDITAVVQGPQGPAGTPLVESVSGKVGVVVLETNDIDGLPLALSDINTSLSGKQATLSDGVNIKTINGLPIMGAGMGLMLGSDSISWLLGSTAGRVCLALGIALELLGWLWIKRLLNRALADVL